jgi:hypothetical protein
MKGSIGKWMMKVLAIYSIAITLFFFIALLVAGSGPMEPQEVYTHKESVVAVVLAVVFTLPMLGFSIMYLIRDIKR